MALAHRLQAEQAVTVLRLRGRVQGVGMRPTVWRLAKAQALAGSVWNEAADVLIEIAAEQHEVERFVQSLEQNLPPLARITAIEYSSDVRTQLTEGFDILQSESGRAPTVALPDAATCPACLAEINDPASRRYRYAFTSCTHCGPRLSIQTAVPWDRVQTSMAVFPLCGPCQMEYDDPTDRRFHAQPVACPDCGPRLQLLRSDGSVIEHESEDEIAAATAMIAAGNIVAIKGLGGFHLACDARNEQAVERLRKAKRREGKPFALMAAGLAVINQYCEVDPASEKQLASATAPIVILPKRKAVALADSVAPGLSQLGMMLPGTPLHHVLLQGFEYPLVMTSGNLAGEPPCIANEEALQSLGSIADAFLLHDREIVNRLDDSILKPMANGISTLRLARGLAPYSLPLPPGMEVSDSILAMGAELKASFCMLTPEGAILGQHIGDLEASANLADYEKALTRYQALLRFSPGLIAVDKHPEYLSRKRGLEIAEAHDLPLTEVQHHHAHVAACMVENAVAVDAPAVLGIALDGLGMGEHGQLWGGEFLLADYQDFERLGSLQAMPLIGHAQAMREPWRNTYAQLKTTGLWDSIQTPASLAWLHEKPLDDLDKVIAAGRHAPLCSSAGRWFDAVAAALGLCTERQSYEGQAAMQLEGGVDMEALGRPELFYDFELIDNDLLTLSPRAMWQALLADLQRAEPVEAMAARFHGGFAQALSLMVQRLSEQYGFSQVALTGGVFQNRILFELVYERLAAAGYSVLSHRQVPANDGGLALGQAVIAAVRQQFDAEQEIH